MIQTCQKILLGSAFGLALAACSSTGTGYDNSMGSSSAGATSSSGVTNSEAGTSSATGTTSGASTRTTPPPNGSTSNGSVIDDRVNSTPDIPGPTR